MTVDGFVGALKIQTSDAAIQGTIRSLEQPPGRQPASKIVRLSEWYSQLSPPDREMLRSALTEAAEMAVFEFLCVLDGVSTIEDTPEKGDLELFFEKDGEKVRLNDPRGQELHNLFNSLCRANPPNHAPASKLTPYDMAPASELRSKLKSHDQLDIHHVPDKYGSLQTLKDYDPDTAPALVVPKAEHRGMSSGSPE